ncbi:unnamed protein product [Parajaminaea phylloscopi]
MMTPDWAILIRGLSGTIDIDTAGRLPTATFLAGTFISDINVVLGAHSPPLAMTSLGSISEQTIGGLVATATHGSGHDFPAVSALVEELEIAVPLRPEQGGVQVLRCNRTENVELFNASLCGLGSTGIITTVKVCLEPAFRLSHLVEDIDEDWILGPRTGWPAVQADIVDEDAEGDAGQAEGSQSPRSIMPGSTSAASRLVRRSIGCLVADGIPLPPTKPRYLSTVRQSSPSDIWPVTATDDGRMSRCRTPDGAGEIDDDDDDATRLAQERIDAIVRSSQHTRLWWFHQAQMCTLSRANRTLQPAVAPTLGQRLYSSIVGYHTEQVLLFLARYHHRLPRRVAKVMYRLNHDRYPAHLVAEAAASGSDDQSAASEPRAPLLLGSSSEKALGASSDPATDLAAEFAGFKSKVTPSLVTLQSSSSKASGSENPKPLRPDHPHSLSVGHSHDVFNMDCLFPQYTTEWSIPYSCTAAFLRALRDWLQVEVARGQNVHFPIEVRWTDADGIWLSHGYGRQNCYVGLMQYRPFNQPVPYRDLFAKFERIARYFGGRPHWAKTHTCGPLELAKMYPHLDDWRRVRDAHDPDGVLLNPYVQRHIYGHIGEDMSVRRFKARQQGKL